MSSIFFLALLILLTAAAGFGLGWLGNRLTLRQSARQQLIDRINAQLPQLQCGDCGYPGCRPYAEAIADGACGIDLCPPGGSDTAQRLSGLLNVPEPIMPAAAPPQVARIDTDKCVGCALCLPACPTDAIIGAESHAHVVIAEHCIGCERCLPPCPVDCIRMIDPDNPVPST